MKPEQGDWGPGVAMTRWRSWNLEPPHNLEHASTYYSGSETRSRAFITSSSRDSGMKPLSEKNKGMGRKKEM